jgi:hypothetical protein
MISLSDRRAPRVHGPRAGGAPGTCAGTVTVALSVTARPGSCGPTSVRHMMTVTVTFTMTPGGRTGRIMMSHRDIRHDHVHQ